MAQRTVNIVVVDSGVRWRCWCLTKNEAVLARLVVGLRQRPRLMIEAVLAARLSASVGSFPAPLRLELRM